MKNKLSNESSEFEFENYSIVYGEWAQKRSSGPSSDKLFLLEFKKSD